jgi:hypothetical protein
MLKTFDTSGAGSCHGRRNHGRRITAGESRQMRIAVRWIRQAWRRAESRAAFNDDAAFIHRAAANGTITLHGVALHGAASHGAAVSDGGAAFSLREPRA